MGLFGSFDIAKSGMYVNERGLFVTGHNITNTNTEGYSRQQIQPTTSFYQNIDNIGQVGTGADVQGIRQVRNKFLDNIYRNEVETLGNYEVKSKTYVDVQAIIDEPFGDGLQNVLNKFWDSWQELAKDPDALAVRALVRQRGEALARQVNHIGTQLNNLQDDINQEIYVKIKEVNEYTQEIASLNGQILEMEIGNDDSNDLRDKRNLIMDKLSKVAGAKYDETSSGHINVEIGEQIVVNRNEYLKIEVKEDIIPGEAYKPKLENSSIDINFTNGQLKGLLDSAGLIGSYDNGSPNTKVDINLVIDNSDTSSDYIEKMKSSVKNYVKDLKKTGLDYNLRLITFSDTSTINSTIWDKDNIDGNLDNFEDNIDTILSGIETENSFSDVISKIESIEDFREDTTKYTVLFTNESIQGNEIDVLEEDVNEYISKLNDIGTKFSVVSNSDYKESGFGAETIGWQTITGETGGSFYDIEADDFSEMLMSINYDINDEMNDKIDDYENTGNIIADVKKRLNALVNVMFREINKLHSSGKTLDEGEGKDFFTAIDDSLPLQIGNIQTNPSFTSLNNIVASYTDKNGDNNVAFSIANIRNSKILGDKSGSLSVDDFYQAIVLTVGTEAAEISRVYENQSDLTKSANDFRKSITDVSMDEEMSNMIRYKYAYSASSRLINVIDEMIETILTKIGN